MDTPPPILAYATPDTGVRFEDDRVTLPQPPPGYEIALLTIAFLVCLAAALLGLLLFLGWAVGSSREDPRGVGCLLLAALTNCSAVVIWRNISRRRSFGHFPCTIRRQPDGRILVHFPTIWGETRRRYVPGQLARPSISRRGWTGNLVPLYLLKLRLAHPPRLTNVVIPFVTPNSGDVLLLEQRLTEMFLGLNDQATPKPGDPLARIP